jgi:hypothetical protein
MEIESLEVELAEALRARLAVIGAEALRECDPERQLTMLREVSNRIVALQAQLPEDTHPQLRHYFERGSYDKALALIERDGLTGSRK